MYLLYFNFYKVTRSFVKKLLSNKWISMRWQIESTYHEVIASAIVPNISLSTLFWNALDNEIQSAS
jgi:hypothetical protein